eukprot:4686919-Pyramimonas_sp.AAC.1
MRAPPLEPSVELLWGHEACEGCADMGGGDVCGHRAWDLRWSSLWRHKTCESSNMGHGGDNDDDDDD